MDPYNTCYCLRCRKPISEEMSIARGICDACAAADPSFTRTDEPSERAMAPATSLARGREPLESPGSEVHRSLGAREETGQSGQAGQSEQTGQPGQHGTSWQPPAPPRPGPPWIGVVCPLCNKWFLPGRFSSLFGPYGGFASSTTLNPVPTALILVGCGAIIVAEMALGARFHLSYRERRSLRGTLFLLFAIAVFWMQRREGWRIRCPHCGGILTR